MRKGLCYSVPMAGDFMAQLILPYDLTEDEVNRITGMLAALPMKKCGPIPQGLTVDAVR